MKPISATDLILNADGSAYHLNLLPGDVADTVITVGDPDRVGEVSRHFDHIELKKGKREFITHTGDIGGKRITVLSTGIGTDNIDIVLNELDALVNIDFETRQVREELHSLDIIRIGTSGSIQEDVPVDSLLASSSAFGLDTLMHYYRQDADSLQQDMLSAFKSALPDNRFNPYVAMGSKHLLSRLAADVQQGITITAPGFYAPQGRQLRVRNIAPELMNSIRKFNYSGQRITNLEMETAGIYGLSASLGHKAISFNVILANRITEAFSKNPSGVMQRFIIQILERIVSNDKVSAY
jgi:uridine phosphorylase